jgi:hypothetical protein
MEIETLQKRVDNNENLREPVKQYLKENFDRLQYSVSFEAVTIEAPKNAEEPVIEASFMSHEDSISRNTIVRVFGTERKEFKEVEIMIGSGLWDEMRVRWAQAQPLNKSVKKGIKHSLNIE